MDAGTDVITALAEQQAELSDLLASLDEADWDRPSRCEGWTVADVVLHLAQTNELAIASLDGRLAETTGGLVGEAIPAAGSIDQLADLRVARERGERGPVVRQRWQASADLLDQRCRTSDPRRRVQWVAGQMSTRTLATTRLAEAWIHTGDIAAAFAVALEPGERLWHIARLAWRTLPYAFAQAGRVLAGPVAFELAAPDGGPWSLAPDGEVATTTIRGNAVELCLVAARRIDPADTGLSGEGPDVDAVLQLVRTYA